MHLKGVLHSKYSAKSEESRSAFASTFITATTPIMAKSATAGKNFILWPGQGLDYSETIFQMSFIVANGAESSQQQNYAFSRE